jgi:hypothetical protein
VLRKRLEWDFQLWRLRMQWLRLRQRLCGSFLSSTCSPSQSSDRATTFFSHGFCATANRKGVSVGEFDIDVLLRDARQLAVQFIGVLAFLHVKAWLEGAGRLDERSIAASHETGIVVQKAEEVVAVSPERWREVVSEEAWEESHVASGDVEWEDLVDAVDLWRRLREAVNLHVRGLIVLCSGSDDDGSFFLRDGMAVSFIPTCGPTWNMLANSRRDALLLAVCSRYIEEHARRWRDVFGKL